MERKYIMAMAAVLLAVAAVAAVRALQNPYKAREAALENRLAQIKPAPEDVQDEQSNFARWKETIESKPSVWKELVPPPPPPPPPPPKRPNTKEMIASLQVTRQGIGDKVRIITQDNPKGVFLGAGDSINGMKIKEVTKAAVTFSLDWNGEELTEVVQRK